MHDTLDTAIGASPASTVDVDRVIATGRRRTRLRRLALMSPAVPAVAVVALALTTVGGSPTAPDNSIPVPPGTAASGAAPVYDETPEQTRQRLETTLADRLAAALPGVTLTNWPAGEPGVAILASDDLAVYESGLELRTTDGEGQLGFRAWRGDVVPEFQIPAGQPTEGLVPPAWYASCSQVPSDDGTTPEGYTLTTECAESVGADGQTILVLSIVCVDCPGQPITLHREAYVTWSNAWVLVSIHNALKFGEPGTTSLAELLLTKEQLVAIASDPELTVAA